MLLACVRWKNTRVKLDKPQQLQMNGLEHCMFFLVKLEVTKKTQETECLVYT